jgi:hypothetical protein
MTADPDAHGWTQADLDHALAQPDGEPRERLAEPQPDDDQP